MSNKVFIKNALYLLASKGTNFIFPLISHTYLITRLDFNHLGIIGFAQIIADFFIIFCDFGFNLSGAKQITEHTDDITKRNQIVNAIYGLKLILAVTSLIAINLLCNFVTPLNEYWLLLNFFFLYVIGQSFTPFWFFQAIQKSGYITVINIISKVLLFLSIIFFINGNEDYILYPVLLGTSLIIPLIIAFVLMIKKEKFRFNIPTITEIRNQFSISLHFFVASLNDGIINYSPIVLLKIALPSHLSNHAIGIYSAAEKYIKPICYLIQPISQALFPHSIEKSKTNLKQSIQYIIKVSMVVGLVMLLFSLFSYFFGEKILSSKWLVGEVFLPCGTPYTILCLLPVFYSQVRLMCTQILLVLNKEKVFSLIYFISSVSVITFGYFITRAYSYNGAAFILPLANIMMLTIMGLYIYKKRYIWLKK